MKEDLEFRYMLLGRLKQDCEYFLNYGNRSKRIIQGGNVEEHIGEMLKLFNQFKKEEIPLWITLEDILEYKKQMKIQLISLKIIDNSFNKNYIIDLLKVSSGAEVLKNIDDSKRNYIKHFKGLELNTTKREYSYAISEYYLENDNILVLQDLDNENRSFKFNFSKKELTEIIVKIENYEEITLSKLMKFKGE